jgi:hypothetical protein
MSKLISDYCLLLSVSDTRNVDYYQTKQTPWPESASELYRPRDRRLLKLVPSFEVR